MVTTLCGTGPGIDHDHLLLNSQDGGLLFTWPDNTPPRPDYETPRDATSNNIYSITVHATDDSPERLFSSYDIAVEVTNVNEQPEFTGTPSTSISQDENELASEILHDYDARDEEAWSPGR